MAPKPDDPAAALARIPIAPTRRTAPANFAHVAKADRFAFRGQTVRLDPKRPLYCDPIMRAFVVANVPGVTWKETADVKG